MLATQVIVPLCCAMQNVNSTDHCLRFWHNCNHPSSIPLAHKSLTTSSRHLSWTGLLRTNSPNKSCLKVWPSSMRPKWPITTSIFTPEGNQQFSIACQPEPDNCCVGICSVKCIWLPQDGMSTAIVKVIRTRMYFIVQVSAPYQGLTSQKLGMEGRTGWQSMPLQNVGRALFL